MRALIQRVTQASVEVKGYEVGRIGYGLVAMLAVACDDSIEDVRYLVNKIVNLRILPHGSIPFDRSLLETSGEILVISQFTLYASTRKGRRPDFTRAAPMELARPLFELVLNHFRETGIVVQHGCFQEYMHVAIHNDGPVTILIDSTDRLQARRL